MFFFFNDTATTEIYTLSLHDALPIFLVAAAPRFLYCPFLVAAAPQLFILPISRCSSALLFFAQFLLRQRPGFLYCPLDRKSTRLNSSHVKRSRMPSSAWKKKNQNISLNRFAVLRVICRFITLPIKIDRFTTKPRFSKLQIYTQNSVFKVISMVLYRPNTNCDRILHNSSNF